MASWCPRIALRDLLEHACYCANGKMVEVPGKELLRSARPVSLGPLVPGAQFEGYPNTLTPNHVQKYGLQSAQHIFRGTLRYQGFSDAAQGLVRAGLLSETPIPELQSAQPAITWKKLLCCLLMGSENNEDWEDQLLSKLDNSQSQLDALKGLGLLSDVLVDKKSTPLDTLAAYLETRLAYAPGERDMTVMQHEITTVSPKEGERTARVGLCVYGDPDGPSAMAKTVGLTVGIAVDMLLKGEIRRTGVVLPTSEDIYRPVLAALAHCGIRAQLS